MPKLIILEGPDESGKSTLAKRLAMFPNTLIFHCTATPKLFDGLQDYHENILANVQMNMDNGYNVILDRFWPSELVYGSMLRPFSAYDWSVLQSTVAEMGGKYVFCYSINGWNRYKKGHIDPAHSLTEDQYTHIWKSYAAWFAKQKLAYPESAMPYSIEDDAYTNEKFERSANRIFYGFAK